MASGPPARRETGGPSPRGAARHGHAPCKSAHIGEACLPSTQENLRGKFHPEFYVRPMLSCKSRQSEAKQKHFRYLKYLITAADRHSKEKKHFHRKRR